MKYNRNCRISMKTVFFHPTGDRLVVENEKPTK